MTDIELAEEIEHGSNWRFILTLEQRQQIIAALRRGHETELMRDVTGEYYTRPKERPLSGEMVPIAAWFYAYTSLGCDPNSAEKMVRAEIANYSAAEASKEAK